MPANVGPLARAAAEISPAPWRWSRPRVLVEHPDGDSALAITEALRFAGYAVAICPGPDMPEHCPLCGRGECATAHDADVVVSCLGGNQDVAGEVARALRARCPGVPLLIDAPLQGEFGALERSEGVHSLPANATPQQIVAAVQELLSVPPAEASGDA